MILALLLAATVVAESPRVPAVYDSIPQVAFDGRDYVFAWTGRRSPDWRIFSARVDAGGNVIESHEVARRPDPTLSAVATNGHRSVIALPYVDETFVLDEHGALLRTLPFGLSLDVASNGDTFALLSPSGVQLLDRDGNPLGQRIAWPASEWPIAVTASGAGYVVVSRAAAGGTMHYFVRGSFYGPPVELDAGSDPLQNVRVATNGSEVFIAARAYSHVRGFLVNAGKSYDWPAEWADDPAVSALWNGHAFVAAFSTRGGTSMVEVGAEPRPIADSGGVLAWNGSRYLFAGHAMARQLPDGETKPFALYTPDQSKPRIATDGAGPMVVWIDGRTTLRASGNLVVTTELDGAPGAVAFDGRDWLVAYPLAGGRIGYRRITRDGALLAESTLPAGDAHAASVGVAASPDGHFALTWVTTRAYVSLDGAVPVAVGERVGEAAVTWRRNAFELAWVNLQLRSFPLLAYWGPVSITTATLPVGGTLVLDEQWAAQAGHVRMSGDVLTYTDQASGLVVVRDHGQQRTYSGSDPAVADNGLVVWSGGQAALPGSAPFTFAQDAFDADVACARGGCFVTFARYDSESSRVYLAPIPLDIAPRRRSTGLVRGGTSRPLDPRDCRGRDVRSPLAQLR